MKNVILAFILTVGIGAFSVVQAQRTGYEPVKIFAPGDKPDRITTTADSIIIGFVFNIDSQYVFYYRTAFDNSYMRIPVSQVKMIQYSDGTREYRPGVLGRYGKVEGTSVAPLASAAPRTDVSLIILFDTLKVDPKHDQIVMMNRQIYKGRVDRIGTTEISYFRMERPDGPVYTEAKTAVAGIVFKNGAKELFFEENMRQGVQPSTGVVATAQPTPQRTAAPTQTQVAQPVRQSPDVMSKEEAIKDPKRREASYLDFGVGLVGTTLSPGGYDMTYMMGFHTNWGLRVYDGGAMKHYLGIGYAVNMVEDFWEVVLGYHFHAFYNMNYEVSPQVTLNGLIRPAFGFHDVEMADSPGFTFTNVDIGVGAMYRFSPYGNGLRVQFVHSQTFFMEIALYVPLHRTKR